MTQINYGVIVVGGGIVGLILALALARAEIPVALIEAKTPSLDWPPESLDAKITSINLASQRVLKNLNVWSALAQSSFTPLYQMHVWDDVTHSAIDFDCANIGAAQLGFIVENRELIRVLWRHLERQKHHHFFLGQAPKQIIHHQNNIELILENNHSLYAQLLVGADGGNSWVRQHMTTAVIERPYSQKAITAVIQSQLPHRHRALQHFLPTGPVALLPLFNPNHSALIWSARDDEAQRLMQFPEAEFNTALNQNIDHHFGALSLLSPRHEFSLMMRHAKHYIDERMVLIGDAAHTIHPLAGQGGNLGILDAACLAQCLLSAYENNEDLGRRKHLRKYERWRKFDNTAMIATMRAFKDVFESPMPLLKQARGLGLNVVNRLEWLKKCFMNYAMGNVDDLPELAKESRNSFNN